MKGLPASSPSRILLPRFDTLGDLVLLEGFLAALQGRFPQARITLLVRSIFGDLAGLFPDSLEWLTIDFDPHRNPPNVSLGQALLTGLRNEPWDLLLATAHNRTWAEDFLAASMPGATRIAFGRWAEKPEPYQNFLAESGLRSVCPFDQLIEVDERSHETDKYQALWEALDGRTTLPEPVLNVSAYQGEAGRQILEAVGLQSQQFFIGCPAGTQRIAIKAWAADCYADIIAWIENTYALPCLLVGHQSEIEIVRRVAESARHRGAHPKTWFGRDGEIPLLAALLKSASFYLGNDTGPMHMAAALDIPVIAIFGGGRWPRFLPRGTRSTAIAGEMPCFGCDWSCLFGDAPCVQLVTINDVKQAVRPLFEGAGVPGPRILKASTCLSPETGKYIEKAIRVFQATNKDRQARLEACLQAEKLLRESEADRADRLAAMENLKMQLDESEADRAARLAEIERLGKQLAENEADRTARLVEIERLGKQLVENEADRANRLVEMKRLGKQLVESEADRAARLAEMERLGKQLAESEADRTARLDEIEHLGKQLFESETDRAARLAEMERLGKQLAESEANRAGLMAKMERLEKIRNSNLVKMSIKLGLIREKENPK